MHHIIKMDTINYSIILKNKTCYELLFLLITQTQLEQLRFFFIDYSQLLLLEYMWLCFISLNFYFNRYNIDQHDYSVRLKAAQKFLKDGDKVTYLH